jgi:hypothetical protein
MWQIFLTRSHLYWKIGIIVAIFGVASTIAVVVPQLLGNGHSGTETSPPRIRATAGGLVCEDAVWNMGHVDATDSPRLSHAFTLRNSSDHPIRIAKVLRSCGCLAAENYNGPIPAGGARELTVTITVPNVPGPFSYRLVIGTDGTEKGADWLTLAVHQVEERRPGLVAPLYFATMPGRAAREAQRVADYAQKIRRIHVG